jgi:hypothetical protein
VHVSRQLVALVEHLRQVALVGHLHQVALAEPSVASEEGALLQQWRTVFEKWDAAFAAACLL